METLKAGPFKRDNADRSIEASSTLSILLFIIGALVILQYRYDSGPIYRDAGLNLYLSELVARGGSLYGQSIHIYTPLGPMIGSLFVNIGKLLDVPLYLGPRYGSALAIVFSAWLLFRIIRTATLDPWVAFVGSIVLLSFSFLCRLGAINLEPKILVMFFTLLSARGLQTGKWWLASAAATCAAMCWQPGAFSLIVSGMILLKAKHTCSRSYFEFLSGFLVALVPSVLYIALTHAWKDAFFLAVRVPFMLTRLNNYNHPSYNSERLFLILGLMGFLFFCAASLRKNGTHRWFGRRMAGIPLLTLFWLVLDMNDFQGPADLVPLLPLLCFWAAISIKIGFAALNKLKPLRSALTLLAVITTCCIFYYGFRDAYRYKPAYTVQQQSKVAHRINELSESEPLLIFNAEEIYTIVDRQSPWRYTRFERVVNEIIERYETRRCVSLQEKLEEIAPSVVVFGNTYRKGICNDELLSTVRKSYNFYPLPKEDWLTWQVYVRRH